MQQPIKIASIGYGSIAQDVIRGLPSIGDRSTLWAVLLRTGSASADHLPDNIAVFHDASSLINWGPSLVIEAAGQAAVGHYVPDILASGAPVVVTSVGALADTDLYTELLDAARHGGTQLIVPSGAIASLDYIGALPSGPQTEIVYESRKPPSAWHQELKDAGHDPSNLKEPITLFEGNAQQAALLYPKNLNVAATLALAGLGMERTRVRVVVDPQAQGNQHKIEARSPLGSLTTVQTNAPSERNPKTSGIVAQSVIRSVRQRYASIQIG